MMMDRQIELLNATLNGFVRPHLRLLGRPWSPFHVCGYCGFAAASGVAFLVTFLNGLSPNLVAMLALAGCAAFFALAMVAKIVIGHERFVCYHYQIAVLIVAALLLWLLGQPILPYLDITVLAVGVFLAFGRMGCLMVGCCHGRPSSWGVRYGEKHAVAGFPSYLVGIRLFPIQLVESIWVLGIVILGTLLVLRGSAPGSALAFYALAYGTGRFCLEFLRGDPGRPYWGGFSEAQWTSLILSSSVVSAEWLGLVPFYSWHVAVPASLFLTMLFVALQRQLQRTPKHRLLHPRHLKEVAEVVQRLSRIATDCSGFRAANGELPEVPVARTDLGIQISASRWDIETRSVHHYALSGASRAMTEGAARTIADLILQLRHPSAEAQFIHGNRGVFHLLVWSQQDAGGG